MHTELAVEGGGGLLVMTGVQSASGCDSESIQEPLLLGGVTSAYGSVSLLLFFFFFFLCMRKIFI